uniref:Reverse transcriptase domain-containing protein n=1 Tax=Caenorhabditis tropicalis TaxID=1561998 RepID=A0A1I7TAP1_9PELO
MVNGKCSEETEVLSGVPQGSVLGPLLFLIYINDIGDNFSSNFFLYADDLKLFSTDPMHIDSDLEILEDWCDKWQMSVAPTKM